MDHEQTQTTSTNFLPPRRVEALGRCGVAPGGDADSELPAPATTADHGEFGLEMARLGVPSVPPGDDDGGGAGRLGVSHLTNSPEVGLEPVPGYRLVSRLGAGATGEVWKASGPGGIPVALKFIHLGYEGDDRPESPFRRARRDGLRSLELMREVRHPNLLTLFGAWYSRGQLVIGMELADGTLMDRADEAEGQGHPGIPLPELMEHMQQAARGIDFLNEPRHALLSRSRMGIQHRDIKPQNLLLVGGGLKVGDFGQAKLLEESVLNTGCLTPAYAAPEFFHGSPSSRSDQYSLAVTYCRLRGGRVPFTGSRWEVMMGHCQGAPDLSMLPEAERPPIARALSKDPAQRWPDCRSLVAGLDAATSPTDLRPQPAPGWSEPARPADRPAAAPRRPSRRAIGLLVATALAGVAVSREMTRGPALADPPVWAEAERQAPRPSASRELDRPEAVAFATGTRPRVAGPHKPAPGETEADTSARRDGGGVPAAGDLAAWNLATLAVGLRASTEIVAPPRVTANRAMPAPSGGAIWSEAIHTVGLGPLPESTGVSPPRVAWPDRRRQLLWVSEQKAEPRPSPVTVQVMMPVARAVLFLPKPTESLIGMGKPEEWYGPRRVVHTKPLESGADFEVGAFWTDTHGKKLTRTGKGRVVPGRTYRVDLRPETPTWEEVSPAAASPGRPNE